MEIVYHFLASEKISSCFQFIPHKLRREHSLSHHYCHDGYRALLSSSGVVSCFPLGLTNDLGPYKMEEGGRLFTSDRLDRDRAVSKHKKHLSAGWSVDLVLMK